MARLRLRGCAFPKNTKATAVPSSKVAKFTRILLYRIHILIRNIYIHIYRANTKIKLGAWVAGREGRTDETTPEVQFAKPRERLEAAGQGDCSVAGDEVSAAGRIPPPPGMQFNMRSGLRSAHDHKGGRDSDKLRRRICEYAHGISPGFLAACF